MTETPDTFPKLLARNAASHGSEVALREKQFGIWRSITWGEYEARRTCGSAITASGAPSAILLPKSSTMMLWEMSTTTPMSCSIISTVMPHSSLRSRM